MLQKQFRVVAHNYIPRTEQEGEQIQRLSR